MWNTQPRDEAIFVREMAKRVQRRYKPFQMTKLTLNGTTDHLGIQISKLSRIITEGNQL